MMRGWLGPFRIERQVGRGGLGAVYRAVDCRTGATVALKMLPPGTDSSATRRLRREFDALRHLDHPNIVRVLDLGEVDGIPWLSMEFVDGMALREWLVVAPALCRPPLERVWPRRMPDRARKMCRRPQLESQPDAGVLSTSGSPCAGPAATRASPHKPEPRLEGPK